MYDEQVDRLVAAMDRATEQFKRLADALEQLKRIVDALERAYPTPDQRDRTFVEFTPINDREGN